jgi:putative two-component system response regulator
MSANESDYKAIYESMVQLSDTVLAQALELKRSNADLEARVRQRTAELEQSNLDAMYMLAMAAEAHDQTTGEHVRRVEVNSYRLARALGLPETESIAIGRAAVLHDVGKLFVSERILNKPGSLDDEERKAIQSHTLAGEKLIADRPYFSLARTIARSHHENFDGSGYPDRLSGEAIPLPARIVRVVDCCDALQNARPYKPAWPAEKVRAYLLTSRGILFDPALVDVMLSLRVEAIEAEWAI